ncbi:DUF881 domain-containing protein [Candidatus Desulforudis audaxviator]|uniref:Division initiation protein n=1 Tax=Desulforudis audaxviator (strain MP104C) TaxID=477974 RepID=B1I4E6_DESAP|nr:DUF881 domain-containing protein [Candidatus Desulforudis audaxviator]ACA59938.1 protein of unknown function DUF881 [Candidatus Desulforudis audaxviator MP104C]AZK59952.1 Division initiation protein [Candidatus Desulforudis audaxviator]
MLKSKFHWALIIVGLVLGLMLSTQFRVQQEKVQTTTVKRIEQLAQEVEATRSERDALRVRIRELRKELDQVAGESQHERLRTELETVRIQSGMLSVTGPGIEVILSDSSLPSQSGQNPNFYVLHDEDLVRVLNELRAAGAEALAINGERIVATSEVLCIGPAVRVNKTKRLTPPYVITAIGNQDTMISALEMRDGVMDTLKYWGIQVSVRRVAEAVVPAYTGPTAFKYARPLFQEGGS